MSSIVFLNLKDSDPSFVTEVSDSSNPNGSYKCYRKANSTSAWSGCRGNFGIDLNKGGRHAFIVKILTPGNIRVGFSRQDAILELGMDDRGWGYGATGTKSHAGKYGKYGQSWNSRGDIITCVLNADRNTIYFYKNGIRFPGDCYTGVGGGNAIGGKGSNSSSMSSISSILYPHVLVKEAMFEVCFLDAKSSPCPDDPGCTWWGNNVNLKIPSLQCNTIEEQKAEMEKRKGSSTGGEYPINAENKMTAEKPPWKCDIEEYVHHFRELLSHEHEAEKESVKTRVKKPLKVLMSEGYGIGDLVLLDNNDSTTSKANYSGNYTEDRNEDGNKNTKSKKLSLQSSVMHTLPYMSEFHCGREVMLSLDDHIGVDMETMNPKRTILGEIIELNPSNIVIETKYDRVPHDSKNPTLYRLDLSTNVASFTRMDRILDDLQRSDGSSKTQQKKDKYKLGILLPNTPLATAMFGNIKETTIGALRWDPIEKEGEWYESSDVTKNRCEFGSPNSEISKASAEQCQQTAKYIPKTETTNLQRASTTLGKNLNASQKLCLDKVIGKKRKLTFVQGPPGTGKTTTAAAIVVEWLKTNKGPILCCAFSNKGADNIGCRLHNAGVNVLRIGAVARDSPAFEFSWDRIQQQYGGTLKESMDYYYDVIICTCVGSGMGLLRNFSFPYVIIDEASQIPEPAALIPLSRNGCVSAVMVGDQCQLPPTILSHTAQQKGLSVSLFDRLIISLGMEIVMLDTQYRMHPSISAFSAKRFYHGRLKDWADLKSNSPNVVSNRKGINLMVNDSSLDLNPATIIGNLFFVDCLQGEESGVPGSLSKTNREESECVRKIIEQLIQSGVPPKEGSIINGVPAKEIGIISPYAAQVSLIIQSRIQKIGNPSTRSIIISSVDSFQGSEKEVIIVSTGYLQDWRRLNVALTRARKCCINVVL